MDNLSIFDLLPEEEAKAIVDCGMSDCLYCNSRHKCIYYKSAELLYNAGYRKINENEVVISKDNYNRLKRDSELYEARHKEKLKLFSEKLLTK